MTIAPAQPVPDDETLWRGLNDHVRSTLGIVGISKMLATRDDDAARTRWVGRMRPVLQQLAAHLPLTPAGPARFAAGDDVTIQFDIHRVYLEKSGAPRIRAMLLVDPAAVALALVGRERWGIPWSATLRDAGAPRPIAEDEETDRESLALRWIAQNPGTPGPWVSAASAEEARDAGLAEDLGFPLVARLFDRCAEVGA